MGEVVVSSEGGMLELENNQETELVAENKVMMVNGGDESSYVVGWERFLPKMAVRVLLVEADDSTRQIIAALLRKCSYRVAAVSDGLKAWEVLKGKPHDIDLILTDVELPAISGYALLTLIMEHDVCKNIPVIMMSSQDSVSTVYKCILRGATDFLVKPVRKNELRNLWQHVWRKQVSNTAAGLGPPDESLHQEKIEASAENNVTSKNSSGSLACRNTESVGKGSDAQSSCTKPESEVERAEDIEHFQPNIVKSLSDDANISLSDDTNIPAQEECFKERQVTVTESQFLAIKDASYAKLQEDKNSDDGGEKVHFSENNHVTNNSSREAIDLIGAFDNYLKGNFQSSASNVSTNKYDISPQLDLSLRRSHPGATFDQVNDESHSLNHSDVSAFSRYMHKPLQPRHSTSPCNQHIDHETNPRAQLSYNLPDYNCDTHGSTTRQPEIKFSYPQKREISVPILVKGIRFENVEDSYGSVRPTRPLPSPGTPQHGESFPPPNRFYQSYHQTSNSQQLHNLMDQSISNGNDQPNDRDGQKVENLEARGHVSPAKDQSGDSSFGSGNMSHLQRTCSVNSNVNGTLTMHATSENEDGVHVHDASHRSMQREAALMKFRLKRKDRCFEKKVRYESRKKLAEQRPRVKGQFVRQMLN